MSPDLSRTIFSALTHNQQHDSVKIRAPRRSHTSSDARYIMLGVNELLWLLRSLPVIEQNVENLLKSRWRKH